MNSINKNFSSAIKNGILDHEDDAIMYILVNKDIKISQSQLISQCCNSIIKVVRHNEHKYNYTTAYHTWSNSDEKKVYLKADQEELLCAINNYSDVSGKIWCKYTLDIDNIDSPFTITTVAFTPMLRKETPDLLMNLEFL